MRRPEDVRILLIDDSITICTIIKRLLNEAGFLRVEFSSTPVIALQEVKKSHNKKTEDRIKPFDLIIVDYDMPLLDGIRFTKSLRATISKGELPIIMLTSSQGESLVHEAVRAGVSAFLTKPPDKELLLERVGSLLKVESSKDKRIGDLVLQRGLVTEEQLDQALLFQREYCSKGISLARIALARGLIQPSDLMENFISEILDKDFEQMVQNKNLFPEKHLQDIKEHQASLSIKLGELLVSLGYVSQIQLILILDEMGWE